MNELFNVNHKIIYDINTTILIPSSFNYINDAIYFINNKYCVIMKEQTANNYFVNDDILTSFNVLYLKNKKDKTNLDELKLKILFNLNTKNQYYIFFNVLTYLDDDFKEKLLNYLKENNKRIINYTTQIEEALLLDYMVVIHENKIIMEGKKELVLQEEKILKKLGYNLPTIVELSKYLKYYKVLNKIYYNKEEMVDDLWK